MLIATLALLAVLVGSNSAKKLNDGSAHTKYTLEHIAGADVENSSNLGEFANKGYKTASNLVVSQVLLKKKIRM